MTQKNASRTSSRTSHLLTTLTVTAAVVAALALSACGRANEDGQTAGQHLDNAVASAQDKSQEARADASSAYQSGKATATEAAQDAKQMAGDAVNKVGDAAITTSIKAELARDNQLSALDINVDTANGQVVLRGTAPDTTSRDRATALARTVKGVSQVDNQLIVAPKG